MKIRFKDGSIQKHASNVGDLISLLKQLPKDLEIEQGFGVGVEVCIYKKAASGEYVLEFEDES